MGNSEGDKPAKPEKPASPPREQGSVHVYPDWAAVQAYYGPGVMPPPYYNTAVAAGHAAQPYMWAPPQMMAPYGSPYAAMYPHGAMYGPSPTPVCMQVATPVSIDNPEKSSAKDNGSGKTTKESDVNTGGAIVNGNSNAESAGDGGVRGRSQSLECGTEGSCDRSDDSTSKEANGRNCNGVLDTGTCNLQMTSVVPGIPLTTVKPVDERELKREKRKQSNRESARRSRLRKQSEMEELGKKVDSLAVENMSLRSEINKLVEDSEKLRSENAALMDKLKIMQGQGNETGSDDQEKLQINTENLISKVDNGVHEQDEENENPS